MIFNGVPDFLYETEVLRLERALWYSPDGQTLMFATYNASAVPSYQYLWYGLDDPQPPAYPQMRSIRYPKVSEIKMVEKPFVPTRISIPSDIIFIMVCFFEA